jgi:hypothetical protein
MLQKVVFCERMGWTFSEYDATPADEIGATWQIWDMREKLRSKD